MMLLKDLDTINALRGPVYHAPPLKGAGRQSGQVAPINNVSHGYVVPPACVGESG